jgi:transcriptional regulator with XRE-family HTH domain
MVTSKEIGRKIKEERERQGLTLNEAARISHIHHKVLKDIENGIFDRIGSLYMKSFIKKYTIFLEMNTADILKLYEEVSSEMPKKEFSVENKFNKDDNESIVQDNSRKIQFFLIAVLFLVLVALIFIFVAMLRSRVETNRSVKPVKIESRENTARPDPGPSKNTGFFNLMKNNDKFSFTVKAAGDVWLQIKDDENMVFSGIMKKGDSRSWDFTSPVTLWTGKAENLKCAINGKGVGLELKGVVKDINISARGIKLNDSWITRTDK